MGESPHGMGIQVNTCGVDTGILVIGVDKIWVTITPNKCWHMEGKIVWSMFFDFIPNCTVIDDVTYK